jgi:hypothetical protein
MLMGCAAALKVVQPQAIIDRFVMCFATLPMLFIAPRTFCFHATNIRPLIIVAKAF